MSTRSELARIASQVAAGRYPAAVLDRSVAIALGPMLAMLVMLTTATVEPSECLARTPPSAEQRAQAREHFERGRQHHDRGEYLEAAQEYQRAYELSLAPKLLFNIAQVYRLAGNRAQAIAYYERYLAEEPDGEISEVAREQLVELKRELETAQPAPPASATATTPPPSPASRPEQPSDPPSPTRRQGNAILRYSGLAVGALGLAGLGLALGYRQDAASISDELNDVTWSRELDDRVRDGEVAERNMWIATGVGAAAIATGAALYVLGRRGTPATALSGDEDLVIAPRITGSTRAVVLSGRF